MRGPKGQGNTLRLVELGTLAIRRDGVNYAQGGGVAGLPGGNAGWTGARPHLAFSAPEHSQAPIIVRLVPNPSNF